MLCLNFHYSESDHKEFYMDINSSDRRLVNHELEQIEAYKQKIIVIGKTTNTRMGH